MINMLRAGFVALSTILVPSSGAISAEILKATVDTDFGSATFSAVINPSYTGVNVTSATSGTIDFSFDGLEKSLPILNMDTTVGDRYTNSDGNRDLVVAFSLVGQQDNVINGSGNYTLIGFGGIFVIDIGDTLPFSGNLGADQILYDNANASFEESTYLNGIQKTYFSATAQGSIDSIAVDISTVPLPPSVSVFSVALMTLGIVGYGLRHAKPASAA